MKLAEVLEYFAQGYEVVFGDYYGDSVAEDVEEIEDEWLTAEEDEWLYIQSVEVDDEARQVYVFVGDDE